MSASKPSQAPARPPRRRRPAAYLFLCLALLACVASALPLVSDAVKSQGDSAAPRARASKETPRAFIPGEILVRFRGDAKAAAGESLTASVVAETGRQIPVEFERARGLEIVRGLRLARVRAEDTLAAIEALRRRPDVLYAEPNYVRRKLASPNDTRYPEQWALKNGSQFGSNPGADINAEQAWDVTTGSRGVVVGVIDEGVDFSHQDLQANAWTNPGETAGNGLDDDGNGYVDDVHGFDFFHGDASVFDASGQSGPEAVDAHGTHVAGIIGASGNNAAGVAGVNWQVGLMSLKILGAESESPAPSSVFMTVRAYAYAKAMRDLYVSSGGTQGANVRVLNNSYGGIGRSQAELDAIRALSASGVLFVVAAGNEHSSNDHMPTYPANYDAPNLIAVAATGQTDVLGNFSNYGRTTVHMSAPGVGILSTTPGNTYAYADGTSMAAPHVSGAAALLLAEQPDISVARLRSALMLSGEFTSFLGFNTVTGRRLNAQFALQSLDNSDATPPAAPSGLNASVSTLGREVRLSWNAPGDDGVNGRATLYEIRFSDTPFTTPAQFEQAMRIPAPPPSAAFVSENTTFNAFYRHTSGYIGVRAVDEVGNAGPVASVKVSFNELAVDPFEMSESAAAPLSTGGTPLGLVGDDKFKSVALPFSFPFYGYTTNTVAVSTNGLIYPVPSLYPPPALENGDGADFFSSADYLTAGRLIAVGWDDLRTDRRAGDDVYVVQPDADRVIIRWQAVTFDTPFLDGTSRGENPVSFEAELKRDGSVVMRYGDGNRKMLPVVGASDGARDAYLSVSHTSEEALKDLTNAQTVSLARRQPDTRPYADLRLTMTADPNPVSTGKRMTYLISVNNSGSINADNSVITDQLPAGTTFVSCGTSLGGSCSGPAAGTNGTVTFNFGTIHAGLTAGASVTVDVAAAPGTTLSNTASITSPARDPDLSNNAATVLTEVLADNVFSNAKQVSARNYYTLALKADGTVWGFGENKSGQVYDGSKDESKILPARVAGIENAVAVSAGGGFGLALKSDGTLWAWGDNTYGQLGNGEAPATTKRAPVQVKGLTNITSVAAGGAHSLALRSDGTVWAWGSNSAGQLGIGAPDQNQHFTPLHVMSDAAAIAAGPAQSLVVKSDGTVWGFGYNGYGLMGQPINVFSAPAPTKIEGLSGVASVAASENAMFAVKGDGTLWAWGDNNYGLMGNGTRGNTAQPTPAQVPGLSGVVSVAAGYTFAYAAKSDGTVWTWGNGLTPAVYTPTQVAGLSNVEGLSCGTTHGAARLSNGTLRTWGANDQGQLGDGTNGYRNSWVDVSGMERVATPVITPEGGTHWPAVDVTVSCPTPGAVMHYTVNSFQDPTESDPVITPGTVLHLTQNPSRVRVRAWKNGMPASATVEGYYSIFDSGSFPPMPNPIDTPYTFVEQHYKDFLNRDSDASGQQFWTNDITSCGANAQCVEVKRINVSAAFFLSIEFQETGYFVYRLEKVAFGRMPRFREFLADSRQTAQGLVVNTPGWEQKLEDGKRSFAELWTRRVDFKAAYDGKTNAEYVDALFTNAGIAPAQGERDALVAALGGGSETRATVLARVAENAGLKAREKNRAFVLMQYFGYLRRDPDAEGYNHWLTKLEQFGGNYVRAEMVKAFLSSLEYRKRFGRP